MLTRPTTSTSAAAQTSISASLQTSISASLVTSGALSTPATTSSGRPSSVLQSSIETSSPLSVSETSSSTNGSYLGTGAIAGIVVGVVVCLGLAAALVFVVYRLRKSKNVRTDLPASSFQSDFPANFARERDGSSLRPTYLQPHVPANFVGEDGDPLRPNELSGDGQLLEMATSNR